MGNEPTVEISSNVKNDLGIARNTAELAMQNDLTASVEKGELTQGRKKELLGAIQTVAAGLKKEANNYQVTLKGTSSRPIRVFFRKKHEICVDMLVYRIMADPNDSNCINVHTAFANSVIHNASAS